MTERSSQATILRAPQGERIIGAERLRKSMLALNLGTVSIGFAENVQEVIETDKTGIAYVGMNSSRRLSLSKGQEGFIATASLAGCTGIAGFAKGDSGESLQFISHYDSVSQSYHFTRQSNPIITQLYGFQYDAQTAGLYESAQLVIAYPRGAHFDVRRGGKEAVFDQWHYLDQLQTTAGYLGSNTEVLFLPYDINTEGHTLAAGRENGREGIFWDGVQVNFNTYLDRA